MPGAWSKLGLYNRMLVVCFDLHIILKHMPIQDQYPGVAAASRQFATKRGGMRMDLHPPNLVVISFTNVEANREDIDEFIPVMESWADETGKTLVLQDLRQADDMKLDYRLYLASRLEKSRTKHLVQRLAFLTSNVYHRVMLKGAFVIAPPPAPYIITTKEAEAIAHLLGQ